MFWTEIHKDCGHIVERKEMPCPENRPGCAVFHFRFVCRKHGEIKPIEREVVQLPESETERWRWQRD